MITHYKGGNTWWYDLTGYGKEGKIEGMQYEDMQPLAQEVLNMLEPKELKEVLNYFNSVMLGGKNDMSIL